MTANQRNGADAKSHQRIHAQGAGQRNTGCILHYDQHGGYQQEHQYLKTALFQQLKAGGVANAGEKQGHENILQGSIGNDGYGACQIQAKG